MAHSQNRYPVSFYNAQPNWSQKWKRLVITFRHPREGADRPLKGGEPSGGVGPCWPEGGGARTPTPFGSANGGARLGRAPRVLKSLRADSGLRARALGCSTLPLTR